MAVPVVAMLYAATGLYAQNVVLTFDDLATTNQIQIYNGSTYYYSEVPTNYQGLVWSNFGVTAGVIDTNSGYQAAVVSPQNVVFNRNGDPASINSATPFSAVSAYLTAAWNDNLQVEALGYAAGALIYDHIYTLSAVAPTLFTFNYQNVDQIFFQAFGGSPHSGYSYSDPPYTGGTWFAMDNLIVMTNAGPRLNFTSSGTDLILTWPTNATGFRLQSTTNLISPVWTTNSPTPVVVNGQNTVTNPISGAQQFFRLSQ